MRKLSEAMGQTDEDVKEKEDEMDQVHLHHRSHLFTVRLWAEDIGGGQTEWRGRVQYVTSGETYYFRDWPTLITYLLKMLPQAEIQSEGSAAMEPSEPDDNRPASA